MTVAVAVTVTVIVAVAVAVTVTVAVTVASRLLAFSIGVAVMFQSGLRGDTHGACSTMSSVAVASRCPYPNYSESACPFPNYSESVCPFPLPTLRVDCSECYSWE